MRSFDLESSIFNPPRIYVQSGRFKMSAVHGAEILNGRICTVLPPILADQAGRIFGLAPRLTNRLSIAEGDWYEIVLFQ